MHAELQREIANEDPFACRRGAQGREQGAVAERADLQLGPHPVDARYLEAQELPGDNGRQLEPEEVLVLGRAIGADHRLARDERSRVHGAVVRLQLLARGDGPAEHGELVVAGRSADLEEARLGAAHGAQQRGLRRRGLDAQQAIAVAIEDFQDGVRPGRQLEPQRQTRRPRGHAVPILVAGPADSSGDDGARRDLLRPLVVVGLQLLDALRGPGRRGRRRSRRSSRARLLRCRFPAGERECAEGCHRERTTRHYLRVVAACGFCAGGTCSAKSR